MASTDAAMDSADIADDTAGPEDNPVVDQDGDGVPVEEDCDDSDAAVFPGAVDIPNDGIDQDCDNQDVYVAQLLNNPNFDLSANGRVANWMQLGGANSWQGDGAEIRNGGQNTGAVFSSRTSGGGALKVWGDYGNNTFSPGESNVFQDFIRTGGWNPDGKNFWFEGWVMMHSSDPLQNSAQAFLAIRCFSSMSGSWSVQNEFRSDSLTAIDTVGQWMYLHSSGSRRKGPRIAIQTVDIF